MKLTKVSTFSSMMGRWMREMLEWVVSDLEDGVVAA